MGMAIDGLVMVFWWLVVASAQTGMQGEAALTLFFFK